MIVINEELGRALRRARLARGWTLHAAATVSGGRFAATSIAGYERAERAISVERFLELCRLYDVPPERLLTTIELDRQGAGVTIVDVSRMNRLEEPQRSMISGFIDLVRARRRLAPRDPVALRGYDLNVLASVAGLSSQELRSLLASPRR